MADTRKNTAADNDSMDDILASIREQVEGTGDDEPRQDASQNWEAPDDQADSDADDDTYDSADTALNIETAEDEDVLDLASMLEEVEAESARQSSAAADDMIDIEAFAASGATAAATDDKVEQAREAYRNSESTNKPSETSDATQPEAQGADMADELDIDAMLDAAAGNTHAENTAQNTPDTPSEVPPNTEPAVQADAAATKAPAKAATAAAKTAPHDALEGSVGRKVHLSTRAGANGLEVSFPAEVLAEALRPLVKDWLADNLPDVVDRLVKEELAKLAEQD